MNKLLAAAESGDVNLVGFLLDWGNPLKSQGPPPELCHPFCQCKKCLPFTQVGWSWGGGGVFVILLLFLPFKCNSARHVVKPHY